MKRVDGAVFRVRTETGAEDSADAALVKNAQQRNQVLSGCDLVDALQVGGNRLKGKLLNSIRIHRRCEEIAHFAPGRSAWRGAIGVVLEDFMDQEPIALREFAEAGPAGFVRRHWIVLHPVTCGESVKIVAWLNRPI